MDLVVTEPDLDEELGTNAYWSISPRNADTGGEAAKRLPIPSPPCHIPELTWSIKGELTTDGTFVWRDNRLNTEAPYHSNGRKYYVRNGNLTLLDLWIVVS